MFPLGCNWSRRLVTCVAELQIGPKILKEVLLHLDIVPAMRCRSSASFGCDVAYWFQRGFSCPLFRVRGDWSFHLLELISIVSTTRHWRQVKVKQSWELRLAQRQLLWVIWQTMLEFGLDRLQRQHFGWTKWIRIRCLHPKYLWALLQHLS